MKEIDLDEITVEDTEAEKRIKRHKRRVRNRIIVSVVFVLLIALVAVGIVFALKFIDLPSLNSKETTSISESVSVEETSTSDSDEIEKIIEELLAEEEVEDPDAPVEEEKTPEELLDLEVSNILANMTVEEKVAAMFIVTPEQLADVDLAVKAGEGTKDALETYSVGGIVYSADNILDKDQFVEMLTNTKSYSKVTLFTCIDEGYGKTSILSGKLGTEKTMEASDIAESMDPSKAYDATIFMADNLLELGINTNLSLKDLTVSFEFDEEGNKKKSDEEGLFGNDPVVAGQMASQVIQAYKDKGMYTVVGLFPNVGSSSNGGEGGLLRTEMTKEQFVENGLRVYESCVEAGTDALMISNVFTPNLTEDNLPATLSRKFINDYVRTELGFEDIILISDSLANEEITQYYDSAQACVYAVKAGIDMIMTPENFKEGYDAVLAQVKEGKIKEERIDLSVSRILKAKLSSNYPEDESTKE